MGSPSFGLRSPSKESFQSSRLYGNQTVTAKWKTNPIGSVFMSALGAQKSLARCGERLKREFVETRAEPRVSKGDSVSCGTRLRALP